MDRNHPKIKLANKLFCDKTIELDDICDTLKILADGFSSRTQRFHTFMNDPQPPLERHGKFLWLWRWFWRVTLVVSLAYAWYCFYVPSNSIAWADNFTSAQQQAAESGKPIILYFTGKWCVPCRIMKRNVWADEQVTAAVNAQFIPVAIDVDNPDDAAVLARYNVVGPPVTIITDPQGNVLQWRAGGIGKSDFLELLSIANPSVAKDQGPKTSNGDLATNNALNAKPRAVFRAFLMTAQVYGDSTSI